MPVRDPKTKLISVRLSESEYRALQTLCESREERSLSDFVRRSLQQLAGGQEQIDHNNRLHHAGAPRGLAAHNDIPYTEVDRDGFGATVTKAILELNRRTEALDRRVRRLGLMMAKRY
jgi:Arc/MetJ-type ribon-helix-helix transcriptional regulator